MRPKPIPLAATLAAAAAVSLSATVAAGRVDEALAERFEGDWTRTCAVAAIVDGERVETGRYCADPTRAARLDGAFEIGSVSKTFNAALLASLVAEGRLSLDDPLADHVPDGVVVPVRGDRPITLRHLATHTAGLPVLPPGFAPSDPADPYAGLTPAALFEALSATRLDAAPGDVWAYSNFGAMLLSAVIAEAAGGDYAAALRERLLAPLGLARTAVGVGADGVVEVAGHRPGGEPVPAWRFHPALSGAGGLRATLDDLVRYVQAQFDRESNDDPAATAARAALAATQAAQPGPGQPMALGWLRAPLRGRELRVHEGGTGGFSSFVAFDPAARRGAIVLADTALSNLGGLASIGLPLLDPQVPVGAPRRAKVPPPELLARLAGDYRLGGALTMVVKPRDGALVVQAAGQPAFEMGFDSAGEFHARAFDAVLRPAPDGAGFTWLQGGGATPAVRVDAASDRGATGSRAERAPQAPASALDEYAGTYPLMPGFDLRVFVEGERLMAQATGQGAFALDPAGGDRFTAAAFGIVIDFERGDDGGISALRLAQGGGLMRGQRK